MTKISSSLTMFHKKLFPVLFLGFLASFYAKVLGDLCDFPFPLIVYTPFLLGPPIIAVLSFCHFRKFIWPMADEVFDDGDCLMIRRGSREERVPLTCIANIERLRMKPPAVKITLDEPGKFRSEILFAPKWEFILARRGETAMIQKLIERIGNARSKRRQIR